MNQEVILIASVILGIILVPSLITVRPCYAEEDSTNLAGAGSQPAE